MQSEIIVDNIELPDLINIEELEKIKKDSCIFNTQFEALSKLGRFDKLGIHNNNLYIQKISPWRYIVRKYKNQNRLTLSNYFNIEIAKYNTFVKNLCSIYTNQQDNEALYKIIIQHHELICQMHGAIKNLRDKYNLKSNSTEISLSMENSYNTITKSKNALSEHVFQKKRQLSIISTGA